MDSFNYVDKSSFINVAFYGFSQRWPSWCVKWTLGLTEPSAFHADKGGSCQFWQVIVECMDNQCNLQLSASGFVSFPLFSCILFRISHSHFAQIRDGPWLVNCDTHTPKNAKHCSLNDWGTYWRLNSRMFYFYCDNCLDLPARIQPIQWNNDVISIETQCWCISFSMRYTHM